MAAWIRILSSSDVSICELLSQVSEANRVRNTLNPRR